MASVRVIRTILGEYGSSVDLDDMVVEYLETALREPGVTDTQCFEMLCIYIPGFGADDKGARKIANKVMCFINTGHVSEESAAASKGTSTSASPVQAVAVDSHKSTTLKAPTSKSVDASLIESGAVDGKMLDIVAAVKAVVPTAKVADVYAAVDEMGDADINALAAYMMEKCNTEEKPFEDVRGKKQKQKKAPVPRAKEREDKPQPVKGGDASVPVCTAPVQQLCAIIPDIESALAEYALARRGNSVEDALTYLLEGGAAADFELYQAATAKQEEDEEDSRSAIKSAVMARYDEVVDTSDKVYRPTLPRDMMAAQPKKQTRYRDGMAVVLAKGRWTLLGLMCNHADPEEVINAGEKYITETAPKEHPDTFVTIKIKRKGARGPGPGWSK